MTTGAGKPGSMQRYGEKNHPAWFKKLQPVEPTTKKSALKTSASGSQDAMEPKNGYKSRNA